MSKAAELRQALQGKSVLVVPYCHPDWAWTCTREWHEERYTLIFNEVLDILRDHPEYRWFIDTENEQLAPFRERCPERMEELREQVQAGRVGVSGGTIGIPHPHRLGGETFIRNMVLGRRYFERAFPGVDLSVLALNDTIFGYSQLPQLVTKCGYRGYRAWRSGGAMDAKGLPREFRWEGLDGTRLLCSRGVYGGLYSFDLPEHPDEAEWEDALGKIAGELGELTRLNPSDLVWWSHGMDDVRPLRGHLDKPADSLALVDAWREREQIPIRVATPAEFLAELEKVADGLPVVTGNPDPVGWSYWYGHIGNDSLSVWRPQCEAHLLAAEKWGTVVSALGGPYAEQEIAALWRDLLTACPHATLWLFEQDYDWMLRLLKTTTHRAGDLAAAARNDVARRVQVKPEAGKPVVVFNDLSWDRCGATRFHLALPTRGAVALSLKDALGHEVPHQLSDVERYEENSLKEADVTALVETPSLGYTTVYIREGEAKPYALADAVPDALDTPFHRLTFEGARLTSLEDRQTGLVLADPNIVRFYAIEDTGPYHFGPLREVHEPEPLGLAVLESGPLFTTVRQLSKLGPHHLTQDLTVWQHEPGVDFVTTLDSVGGDGFFKVHFEMPVDGALNVDVPFGVEPRDVTAEPYGEILERRRANVFYGSTWVDCSDGARGMALLIEPGMQGFSYDPETRVLAHTLLKVIVHPTEGWERHATRLREGKGRQVFRYRLLPHLGDWQDADLPRRSLAWQQPLTAVKPLGERSQLLPDVHSFLSVSAPNVLLSALYRDEGRVVLRLYEAVGEAADVELALPFAPQSVTETDFVGRRRKRRLELVGETVRLTLAPWEVVLLRLEGAGAP
jgi:alpha-mannosidase